MAASILLVVLLFKCMMIVHTSSSQSMDSRGYIVYCPCMGRFGNQADQFLGALRFAKLLDRTMVVPHWIEFDFSRGAGSMQIPFDKYFKVAPLLEYHRVVLIREFVDDIAPSVWPAGSRTVFCYRARDMMDSSKPNSCNAKDGNPFGPFWDAFGIDFDRDEFFGPLLWKESDVDSWRTKYPADEWPVLAFTGAPAQFPVSEDNAKLHKHLQWSDDMDEQALEVIDKHLTRPYIGAHLRIGSDWSKACRHVTEGKANHLFSSPQCLGHDFRYGLPTKEMCLPSVDTTVKQLLSAVQNYGAKSVFIASDDSAYHKDISAAFSQLPVQVYWLPTSDKPHLDLAILAKSDHYIGNCMSSFSAFAARERRANGLKVSFWGFNPKGKDEL